MKHIEFKESLTQRIYNDYLKRVEKCIEILSKNDKLDMLMEINSHIFEGMQTISQGNESENLLNILEKLGAPEDYLKATVADKKLNEAVRSFKPKAVFQALFLSIKYGMVYSLFAFLYLPLIAFIVLIFAKLAYPAKTGLFYVNGQFQSFGFMNNTNGMSEILGYWFIPMVIVGAILFYFLITLLLRFTKMK